LVWRTDWLAYDYIEQTECLSRMNRVLHAEEDMAAQAHTRKKSPGIAGAFDCLAVRPDQ
jgi:hypothetical protein